MYVVYAYCALLVLLCWDVGNASARKSSARKGPPLMEEQRHRKWHSNSECLFGKQHKELGSTWFADLGPPFDVMYCVKCECVKVVKDGRIMGQTKCRNIAKECQELTCDDQVAVVGRCCKVCRNETELVELQDMTSIVTFEDEEKSFKREHPVYANFHKLTRRNHYAALLTNTFYAARRNVGNVGGTNSVGQIGTGRFTLHKRNLYYSFYTSTYPLSTRPKSIQFVDNNGNILEEHVLPAGSLYQNQTLKICGMWRRVSSEFRALLKEEKLSVVLMWQEYDVRIRGALMRYRPLPTEMLSSLMLPASDALTDAAGTAVVSIATATPSVYAMVIFSGLLNLKKKAEVELRLVVDGKSSPFVAEKITVEKPSPELNVIEFSTPIGAAELQALVQKRVTISLTSVEYKDSIIQGKISPRVQCELYQSVMSSSHAASTVSKYYQKPATKASGIAWMFVDSEANLQYRILLDNVADVQVELVNHHQLTRVESLATGGVGSSSGAVPYISPKLLELLYTDELAVNVMKTNGNNPSLIRGRLTSRTVADSRDTATPYLLKRSDTSIPADTVGLIWVRIDNDCILHYDISVVGKDTENPHQYELYLEDIPLQVSGAPVTRRLIEEFSGNNVEGYSTGLSQKELVRLESSIVYLDIWDMSRGQSLMRTRWDKMSIPGNCRPRNADTSSADNNISSYPLPNEESEQQPEISKCLHGSQFYEHGTQWTSTSDDCSMCNCNHGVTKCDAILCPVLDCAQKYTIPGSCCQSCYNINESESTSNSGCSLGGQTFAPGSVWHPYIPPYGFSTCTICHCDPKSLLSKCTRIECPPLGCDEKTAFLPDKKSCCKVCPNKPKTVPDDVAISDQQIDPAKYSRDVLASGGCKYPNGGAYENGKEWHPRIYFHGVQKCVTCRCKDGVVTCERKKCTKHNATDQCCMKKSKGRKTRRNRQETRKEE